MADDQGPSKPAAAAAVVDAKVQLCSVHGNDLVPLTCPACKACRHMMRENMSEQLVVDHETLSVVPTATGHLLRKRSDKVEPTLVFTEEEMNFAELLATQGLFRRGHFDEITKKHLFFPPIQNKRLCGNMETEALFRPYEHDPKYAHIFSFKMRMLSVLKHLRIASQPFVLAIRSATDLARHTRATGESLGYGYPSEPPEVLLRGPTKVLDYLTPTSETFFPLPHVMDPLEGVQGLDEVQRSMIVANHNINLTALQDYHTKVSTAVRTLYNGVSQSSLRLDNCLQFGSELLSHVDGSLLELARNKVLSLFKGRARGDFFRSVAVITLSQLS